MVESRAVHRQPQEEDEEDYHQGYKQFQINQVEQKFHQSQAEFTQGIQKLKEFKKEVSVDLIDIYQRVDNLKDKLRKFAKADDNKINGLPAFTFNDEFYDKPFKVEADTLLAGLDENISGWTSRFE